ncbi:unnamed protein product [Caenorhabditis bovis]|uniref:Rab5 GDP/GTP exchange factor n=1 Tax=Caenorhabditis bovis TaxID=2654633 RepID=A0A8S1EJ93_9PELO|nr:unnamed protein product [Caenorhabditis bovis]
MSQHAEDEENKRIKVQIREKDLLCINGCGFYGTPQWENRCSKCWRAHQVVLKRNQDFAKNKTLLSFDQFQERRKSTNESRSLSIKKIFKSPLTTDSLPQSPTSPIATPSRKRELSPDSRAARERLTDFLVTNLPTAIVQEVTRQVKHAANKIFELRIAPDDLSELVQGFYQYLTDKLNASPFFTQKKCPVSVQDVMEEVEKFICTSCYSKLFCASSDEEVADVSLQDRIRSLHWVTAGFLETKLDFKKQTVRNKLDEAIGEMIEVNSKRSTSEKLECLVRCSHFIFEALSESGAPTSADEFLPIMIFVLLRGNPPLIQSNVKFISRFALPTRVMSGESAYFFTNLSCALQFVQDMNHESLKMDKCEFEAYTSGQLAPPLSVVNCVCNQAIFTLEGAMDNINFLIEKQNALLTKIQVLDNRIETECAELTTQFKQKLDAFPGEKYRDLRAKIIKEEKLTAEAFGNAFSRQSSDSGRGTLTVSGSVPNSPQPQPETAEPPLN